MALKTVDEAWDTVRKALVLLDGEDVAVADAIDRALVDPVVVHRTLPPWDNSAMDGFAVAASDVRAGASLTVSQEIFAGQAPAPLVAGTCARIMTGAPMPAGADAVVMQERTRREGSVVTFEEAPRPGANVRKRGEDVREGEVLFPAGRVVSLSDAGALWGQGLERVRVRRRPTVAICSGGDELADVGSTDRSKIIDSNTPVLIAAAQRAGAVASSPGRARDTLESHREHFAKGLGHDVLVTVAGASVGDKDFTREALVSLGVDIDFFKVAMKPGKPFAFGTRTHQGKTTFVFGLPGNPVSAMVTFELFVRPALRLMQGLQPLAVPGRARLASAIKKQPGLRLFVRARTEVRDGGVTWAVPLASQSSGALSSASGASCLIDLPLESGDAAEGSEISTFPLSWGGG
ncbi:MAG: gephyrin-like molybdotransferase Glp [Myxococcaceae bacterium]